MTTLLPQLARVKQLALLAIFLAAFTSVPTAQAVPNARPLVELESHIEWSAVVDAWKAARPGWVAKTTACASTQCVAGQLGILEQHIEWKAVSPEWKTRRAAWVNSLRAATTDVQVANLLLELETNIGWGAVNAQWKAARPGWVARVKGQ